MGAVAFKKGMEFTGVTHQGESRKAKNSPFTSLLPLSSPTGTSH